MFKNAYQSGLLTIFYSGGSSPLGIWDMEVQNGHIKRLTDKEVGSVVLEIASSNVARTYITCPKNNQVLGIRLPFMVMIIKNLKRYFSFEIMILDDKNMRRRFRISNFQSTTKIKPFCTTMPIGLSAGWNQIQFNLADFTRRAYGSQFIETLRVQIHANARLRRIYFCDHLYTDEELPQEYKLYMPLEHKKKKGKEEKKEEYVKSKSVLPTAVAPVKSRSKTGSVDVAAEPEIKTIVGVPARMSEPLLTPEPTEDENMLFEGAEISRDNKEPSHLLEEEIEGTLELEMNKAEEANLVEPQTNLPEENISKDVDDTLQPEEMPIKVASEETPQAPTEKQPSPITADTVEGE